METLVINIVCIVLISLLLVFGFYVMIRNEMVCRFRIIQNHIVCGLIINYLEYIKDNIDEAQPMMAVYNSLNEKGDYLRNKYTYAQMLFSFKPLRLECWYTEDELSFLKEYKQFIPDSKKIFDEVKKALKDD